VNALAVGAADTPGAGWARASYSSVGPGRSPGLIKPDLVAFGGSTPRPFLVLSHDNAPKLEPTGGTSFSAPCVLRMGTGVRAHFGDALNPLALRALLIHCVEPADIPLMPKSAGDDSPLILKTSWCAPTTRSASSIKGQSARPNTFALRFRCPTFPSRVW